MNRKFSDDVATSEVVWAAAERIGKSSNVQDITRIIEYLVSKHWVQTAGDLRIARQSTSEWQSLEVPARLKIAIQEVLDLVLDVKTSPAKPVPATSSHGVNTTAVDVVVTPSQPRQGASGEEHPSTNTEQPSESSPATTVAGDDYSVDHRESSTGCVEDETSYAHEYAVDGAAYSESATQQAVSPEDAAAHAAAWEAYYAANGYYSYGTYGARESEWDYSQSDASAAAEPVDMTTASSTSLVDETACVVDAALVPEGTVVDARWAEHPPVESMLSIEEGSSTAGLEVVDSAVDDAGSSPPVAWSCGQCTYINPITLAFCEMCSDHISLSPDAPSWALAQADTPVVPEPAYSDPASPSPVVVDDHVESPMPPPPASVSPPLPPSLTQPRFVSISCPAPPLSPLYSPSAPDFDLLIIEEPRTSPAKPVFQDLPPDGDVKTSQISPPVPPPPSSQHSSPPKVDYRALAFKRTPSMPSTTPTSPPRSATEFTF